MELVQELRELVEQAWFRPLEPDERAKMAQAADLLEEALKALERIRDRGYISTRIEEERDDALMVDAILTKSQGEKIDG